MTTQASSSVCFCSVHVPLGGCLSHLQVCDEAFYLKIRYTYVV